MMKWYNYYNTWIDISKCARIDLDEPDMEIKFYDGQDWNFRINFSTRDDYRIEADKIKTLMGVNKTLYDQVNDWTPGRCC